MPYNTRRKSLSLPSLGIHLPVSSRAHRPTISKSTSSSAAEITQPPPSKRVKRSHAPDSPSPISPWSTPRPASSSAKTVTFADGPKSSGRNAYEHTPPPSPGLEAVNKIDLEAVNDDIVAGVIEQLEKTGNRPHLIKELSTILSSTNHSVAGSANPAALLSSRLATYMRRPTFDASNPCPIAKELIPIHPRKVFYYLTTSKHQELPPDSSDIILTPLSGSFALPRPIAKPLSPKRIISPSLSNASVDDSVEMERPSRDRRLMSPSPELELAMDLGPNSDAIGAADFPSPPTPAAASFGSQRGSVSDEHNLKSAPGRRDLGLNSRAKSPPLEGDEREFETTARGIKYRGMSMDENTALPANGTLSAATSSAPAPAQFHLDESEEEKATRNREAVATLFGTQHGGNGPHGHGLAMMSSPDIRPKSSTQAHATAPIPLSSPYLGGVAKSALSKDAMNKLDDLSCSILGESAFSVGMPVGWETMAMGRCELVGLDELDEMLGEY